MRDHRGHNAGATDHVDASATAAPGETRAAVLEVRNAHKRFGESAALAGAGLELHRGEWLGLLGPNGAGKTTLVRAVAGRVRLDRGEVRLFGRGVAAGNSADLRARLGIVPQELALYPLLSARENLAAFGAFHGLRAAELTERVDWALQWTGLAERAREPIRNFSGGMKRRLNIACGVLHKPQVVLLDEPTVGVDPQSRQRIWDMCAELRSAGAALLLTTHQLDEAQALCDRIVIIDHGKAIAAGTVAELVAQTVGSSRRVTLTLAAPLAANVGPGFEAAGARVSGRVREVGSELAALLARVQAAGGQVEDVHIEAPTLHAVFLHLTGRELRE